MRDAFFEHFVTPSNTLVIIQTTGGNPNLSFMTNGTVPHTDLTRVVISSKCFNSIPSTETSEAKLSIAGIRGQRFMFEYNDKHEQICEVLTPYELQQKKEVTTAMDELDGVDPVVGNGAVSSEKQVISSQVFCLSFEAAVRESGAT